MRFNFAQKLIVVALGFGFATFSAQAALPQYNVVDIGTLGGKYTKTLATGLNEAGQVSGYGYEEVFYKNTKFVSSVHTKDFVTDANGANIRVWSDEQGSVTEYHSNGNIYSVPFVKSTNTGVRYTETELENLPYPSFDINQSNAVLPRFDSGKYVSGSKFVPPGYYIDVFKPNSSIWSHDNNSSGQVVGNLTVSNAGGPIFSSAILTEAKGLGGKEVDFLNFNNFNVANHAKNGKPFFTDATAINNLGQFLAFASNGHSYLISPINKPTSIAP
jgi:hypothetical protein